MEKLTCPICLSPYNLTTQKPLLFQNCGHTYCSLCITKIIKNTKDNKIECPKNKNCIKISKNSIFPENIALLLVIEKSGNFKIENEMKKNFLEISKIQNRKRTSNFFFNFCLKHKKSCELICESCKILICTDCVLFDIHKNCVYLKIEDFKKKIFFGISKNLENEIFFNEKIEGVILKDFEIKKILEKKKKFFLMEIEKIFFNLNSNLNIFEIEKKKNLEEIFFFEEKIEKIKKK